MDDAFGEAIGRPRLLAQLLGIFAGLAILLAAIGSYGVLSYMVTERRREIGIRMALGADRGSVMRMVLGQGLRLTFAGVAAGLAAALAMNRVLASLLFGVRPTDLATIASVVALIGTVALVACYLPARLATRIDPMIVLREE
jgi:putative ABC transport system permease protein